MLAAAVVLSFGMSTGSQAQSNAAFTPEKIREVVDKFRDTLVVVDYSIEYYDPRAQRNVKRDRYCTGIVVDGTGLIMVRGHVSLPDVKPFNVRVRMPSGERYDATVLDKDKRINVAFVKLVNRETEPDLPFATFATGPSLAVGDEIMVMGVLPEVLDFERTFMSAHVASVIETPRRVFVMDSSPPYGMIGGPVINAEGEAVGVVGHDLARSEGGEIYIRAGYPLVYEADLFQHLIENPPTKVPEAWLGVFIQPLTDDLAQYWGLAQTGGIVVSTPIKDSPAQRAGLLRGDVIKEFDGEAVSAKEDADARVFMRMVRESGIGRDAPITLIRDGEEMQLSVPLEESPKTAAEAEKYEDKQFGLTVREITADYILAADLDPGLEGLVVDRVERAGWASLAGLVRGDILKRVDGRQVATIEEFKEILADIKERKPKEIAVFIERGRRTGFLRIEPDWKD
jgi:serine protease Do